MSERPHQSPPDDHQEPLLPVRLVEELRALAQPGPLVPPAVDQAILAQARAHLRPIARTVASERSWSAAPGPVAQEKAPALVRVWFTTALGVAAALALGLGLAFVVRHRDPGSASVAREDVDGNGRVDMLDALAVARQLHASPSTDPATVAAFDVNGDGVVDQRDIEQIAARAVKLTKG